MTETLEQRARRLIPGGVQTVSKGRYEFDQQRFAVEADGCYVWLDGWLRDTGRAHIDHVAGLGSVILGHCNLHVNKAVQRQIMHGVGFPLPTPLEADVAELICEALPSVEMVRFCKNGADACAAAVRLARASTGRERVLTCGYHGYQDWCQVLADQNGGIPLDVAKHTTQIVFDDIQELTDCLLDACLYESRRGVAAVIVEPVMSDGKVPSLGYLTEVRSVCDKYRVLLIFDEMITGFRMAKGGAQEFYGVTPDLTCLGKAMGNGFPLAAVCGRADIMRQLEDNVFFSTTFAGEAVSLAAAKATLEVIRDDDVPAQLAVTGRKLQTEYRSLSEKHGLQDVTEIVGYPQRPVIRWKEDALRKVFDRSMLEQGHIFQGYHNLMQAFDQEALEQTVEAYGVALGEVVSEMTVKSVMGVKTLT